MTADDYLDIEEYILRWSAAGPSIGHLRPLFPRWREQLLANGVERVSVFDAVASNLMIAFTQNATPKAHQNRAAMHDHRNLLYAQGVPMLRGRGWKV